MNTASTISTSQRNSYPVFLQNQLLTADELNDLFTYLDRQNRDTRVFGVGIGILSGLIPSFDKENITLTVTSGVGISSDGQLFHMIGDCLFNQYGTYGLSSRAFDCEANPNDQVSLKESEQVLRLFEGSGGNTLDTLPRGADPTDPFLIVLYRKVLKSTVSDETQIKCLISSDASSSEVLLTNELLLIKSSDYHTLFERKTTPAEVTQEPNILPTPFIDRIGRGIGNMEIADDANIINLPAISSSSDLFIEYARVIRESIPRIVSAYENIYGKLASLLNLGVDPFTGLAEMLSRLVDEFSDQANIQYVYDYIKDLIAAYEELAYTFRQLISLSSQANNELVCIHPNHLLLGILEINNGEITVKETPRSTFIDTLPKGIRADQIEKLKFLFNRMALLVQGQNLDFTAIARKNEIRITPSYIETSFLSERALPFYYKDGKIQYSLRNGWNFLYRHQTELTPGYDLSAISNVNDPLRQPLLHNLAKYPFLRIEGHIGQMLLDGPNKDQEGVLSTLQKLRLTLNLPFDIYCLKLGEVADPIHSVSYFALQRKYWLALAELNRLLLLQGEKAAELIRVIANQTEIKDFDFYKFKELFEVLFLAESPYYYLLGQFEQLSLEYSLSNASDQLQEKFSIFAECYPGLEHQAGVPQGGTFFLVYDDQNIVVADFTLPYIRKDWKIPIEVFAKGNPLILSPRGSFFERDDTVYSLVGYPLGGEWILTQGSRNENREDLTDKLKDNNGRLVGFQPSRLAQLGESFDLTYKLSEGKEATESLTLLEPNNPPEADFFFTVNGLMVAFEAGASQAFYPANIKSYEWDFGDGENDEGETPNHIYKEFGTYQAQLTVIDTSGLSDVVLKPVILIQRDPDLSVTPQENLGNATKKSDSLISSTIDDPITLFNQRRQAYTKQLSDLLEEASFAKLKSTKAAKAAIEMTVGTKGLDASFSDVAKLLIGRIKPGDKRLAQYQELFSLLVLTYLDKKLASSKEVISPDLQMLFNDLKKRSEERPVTWKAIQKAWNANSLKKAFDKELIQAFSALIKPL
ncbi:MAG: PKD domain-containing protein [Bacteroidota bacterium]